MATVFLKLWKNIFADKSSQEVDLTVKDNANNPIIYETAQLNGRSSVTGESFSRSRPENPFSSTKNRDQEEVYREKSAVPVPIRPVQVSHNGIPIPNNQFSRDCAGRTPFLGNIFRRGMLEWVSRRADPSRLSLCG